MGDIARFKNRHARVETRVLKTLACRNGFGPPLSNGRQRVGAFKRRACRKNAFKHSYRMECGNRLRVGVRAKMLACQGLRVGPSSKHGPEIQTEFRCFSGRE